MAAIGFLVCTVVGRVNASSNADGSRRAALLDAQYTARSNASSAACAAWDRRAGGGGDGVGVDMGVHVGVYKKVVEWPVECRRYLKRDV